MEAVLATLYVAIGRLAVAIQPVIPDSAAKLLDHMGVPAEARSYEGLAANWYADLQAAAFTLAPPTPLFPRLEMPAEDSEDA